MQRPSRGNAWSDYYQKEAEFQEKLQHWAQSVQGKARANYESDLNADDAKAEDPAKMAMDNTEVSLLAGQGPQFVLEFTAIIVIIFSAVILGVLGKLSERRLELSWQPDMCFAKRPPPAAVLPKRRPRPSRSVFVP